MDAKIRGGSQKSKARRERASVFIYEGMKPVIYTLNSLPAQGLARNVRRGPANIRSLRPLLEPGEISSLAPAPSGASVYGPRTFAAKIFKICELQRELDRTAYFEDFADTMAAYIFKSRMLRHLMLLFPLRGHFGLESPDASATVEAGF